MFFLHGFSSIQHAHKLAILHPHRTNQPHRAPFLSTKDISILPMSFTEVIRHTTTNPLRSEVLKWYRKCIKSAFEVNWESTEDALYVLSETRKLFRQNENLRDVEVIERKVREAEMRYELAVHYRIPYPRPYNKAHGSIPSSPTEYIPYMDSAFDGVAANPMIAPVGEGLRSATFATGQEHMALPDHEISWDCNRRGGDSFSL